MSTTVKIILAIVAIVAAFFLGRMMPANTPTPPAPAAEQQPTAEQPDATEPPTTAPDDQPTASQPAAPDVQPTPPATPTATPPSAAATTLFGVATCTINGMVYHQPADATAIWNGETTLRELAKYGGICNVTTFEPGFYWAVSAVKVTYNGIPQPIGGMAVPAPPGEYVFVFSAPKNGVNESNGFLFKETIEPNAVDNAFATGECVINGVTYTLSWNQHSVWQEGETLAQLQKNGGTCAVTLLRPGFYWSVAGQITRNGVRMANGQRLVAEPGEWVFSYLTPGPNNGFVIRDSVPYP